MVSKAKIFTEASGHGILSTDIFPDFIYSYKWSYKINNSNMLALRINSTGSYAQVMSLKILPESKHGLNIIQ